MGEVGTETYQVTRSKSEGMEGREPVRVVLVASD